MFYTLAETVIYIFMIAAALRGAVWLYKDWKRQQLQELRDKREAARAAEMEEISLRISAEMLRERTMRSLNAEPLCKPRKPIRKATGLFSDEAAQALLK